MLASSAADVAITRTGNGAWVVGRDGAIYSYGEDGGVVAFGEAPFYGSTGGVWTGTHIVGIVGSGTGAGYLFLGANGALVSFGDAPHFTAAALRRCTATVLMTSIAGTSAMSRVADPKS